MATLITFMNITLFIRYSNSNVYLLPGFVIFSIGYYLRLSNSIGFNFPRSITSLLNGISSAQRCKLFLIRKETDFVQPQECNESDIANINLNNFSYCFDKVNKIYIFQYKF
jgi:hypothetical protein